MVEEKWLCIGNSTWTIRIDSKSYLSIVVRGVGPLTIVAKAGKPECFRPNTQ
jgi:hypothetical protein